MDRTILEGAARVLERDGPAAFNTNRVAERAGVSVGSLYQYYPNKAALLFRLHEEESESTLGAVAAILGDADRSLRQRVFDAVRAFFETEAAEAPLRHALRLAALHFRESKEFDAIERRMLERIRSFLVEATPARRARHAFDAEFLATILGSVSEAVTERGIRGPELRRWADECSAMLCKHLGL